MDLIYRCGHQAQVDATVGSATCPVCGRDGVSVARVRPPRFRGAVLGPCAETDFQIAPFRARIVVPEGQET